MYNLYNLDFESVSSLEDFPRISIAFLLTTFMEKLVLFAMLYYQNVFNKFADIFWN